MPDEDKPWLKDQVVRPLVPANLPRHEPDEPETAGVDPAAFAAPIPVVGGNAPGYRQSDILPLARREDVIKDPNSHWYEGWALAPGPLRALGQTPAENTTIDPNTGTMNIAPEALTAATALGGVKMGRPLEIRPTTPTPVPPGLAAREAPLSADFREAPIAPAAAAKIATTPPGDLAPGVPANQMMPRAAPPRATGTGPDRQYVDSTKPFTYNPPSNGWPAGTESWAAPPSSPTGIPAPRSASPPASVAPTTGPPSPKTAAEAKQIASGFYDQADRTGGTLTPEFTNSFIDAVKKVAPQTQEGLAVAGETPVTSLVSRIGELTDKPISLKGAQEIDEALSNLIDKEYGLKGLSKEGKNLFDLQSTFRDMIASADESQVAGGREGFDAIVQGRKAWAQAMKMGDLERIQQRAELTDNPATSIKSGLRVLLSNPKRIRGYSDEEVAALQQAAERGTLGSLLHVFGSRLIPMGASIAGSSHGPLGSIIAGGTTHIGTTAARNLAENLQTRRLNRAITVLGEGVPQNQMMPPP